MSAFKARAILLLSGPGNHEELEKAKAIVQSALSPFSLAIDEIQSINIAGRLILAILISCDDAHLPAIEKDVREHCASLHLDVAAELL